MHETNKGSFYISYKPNLVALTFSPPSFPTDIDTE